MRVGIGIILIVVSSVLFTMLLPQNSSLIWVAFPLYLIGFCSIYSKIHEMEDDILLVKSKLDEALKDAKVNGRGEKQ